MLILHGAGVGKGIAIGKSFVLHRASLDIPEYLVPKDHIEEEVERFQAAVNMARQQLEQVRAQIPKDAPSELPQFLNAHLLMLDDPLLAQAPVQSIRENQHNAEWALKIHSEALIEVFEQMEDDYLRSKTTDIEQVVNRMQRNLLAVEDDTHKNLSEGVSDHIVVTNDLTPADTILLKNQHVRAFVTNLGGPISHTAILARSLQIPAIVGLHGAARYIRQDDDVIVDGKRGILIVAPDQTVLEEYRKRQSELEKHHTDLVTLIKTKTETRDGTYIHLMANIELPADIEAVQKVAADGVGLYRTEYLFMNRVEPPSEEEQFEAYSRVVRALKCTVTIRTLDLGADKQVDGGRGNTGAGVATNPALGLRAVRLCLQDPGLFRPQLRAILRASAYGQMEIMIPMVSTLDELDQVLDLIDEIKKELHHEGLAFDPDVPVGGMIEVPAAAIAADLFAQKLDFLSIGTNDLIQYTLAIDRVDDAVNYLYDPLHPSVLRLIRMVIEAGNRYGIPVSMCGEMAGEVNYTRLLLALGLERFSMDPTAILEVKNVVINSDIEYLREATEGITDLADASKLYDMVERLNYGISN